jgi:O-antigen/teichoic acid export membrane protein
MTEAGRSLASGRVLARSAVWNVVGMTAPLLVGLIAIPLLIQGMGKERFGLLAIIWMGVGYFSVFDLGLGRALTKMAAERVGSDRLDDFRPLIWTAMFLMTILGIVGSLLLLAISGPLVHHVLNVEPQLQREATTAFRILAAGLPVVVITAALIGLLEAHQRFGTIASIRIPLGVLTFAGPLVTLQFSPSLAWATSALLFSRTVALAAYLIVASGIRPELLSPTLPWRTHSIALLRFGGWLTVTNLIGPLMTYLDRFFIGAILTMTAVAYYVTPYEILVRAQVLPQSIMTVLFPAMAAMFASDRVRLIKLYSKSSQVLLLLMLPVTSAFFLLAPEALEIWLGQEFSTTATPVVRFLAVGVLINTLARPAFTVLQSTGRPDLVAKAHLAELGPYLLAMWYFTHKFGIAGTAAVWSVRMLVDAVVLSEIARWNLPELARSAGTLRYLLLAILGGFAMAYHLEGLIVRTLLLLLVGGWCSFLLLLIFRKLYARPSTLQEVQASKPVR